MGKIEFKLPWPVTCFLLLAVTWIALGLIQRNLVHEQVSATFEQIGIEARITVPATQFLLNPACEPAVYINEIEPISSQQLAQTVQERIVRW